MAVEFSLSNSRVVAEATPAGVLAARVERGDRADSGPPRKETVAALRELAHG